MGRRLRNGGKDGLEDTFEIIPDIVVPEAQHRPAVTLKMRGPSRILLRPESMLSAVQFHGKTDRSAAEIDDITIDH